MNCDITDQYLTTTYDNFTREQQNILMKLKTSTDEKETKELTKQINCIHILQVNLLKLKSLKNQKKIKDLL